MATRSNIGIENDDGTVDYIYCHWDGYPTHVGAILLAFYSDPKVLRKLIDLGNLSSLREKIDFDTSQPHDFSSPQKDVCIFYGRDRKEEGQGFSTESNIKNFQNLGGTDYLYILTKKNKWYFIDYNNKKHNLKLHLFKLIKNKLKDKNIKDIFTDKIFSNQKLNEVLINQYLFEEAEKEKLKLIKSTESNNFKKEQKKYQTKI